MYDIIVAGGGPAGLTAAMYAARSGKDVLVLESRSVGGQICDSPQVSGCPGLPDVTGVQFAGTLARQAQEQGVHIRKETITFLRTQNGLLELTTDRGRYSAVSLILANGVTHRKLGLDGEDRLIGSGVSYCALCDGASVQNRPVAVVGGGDTALQEALFLAERCSKVTLIHRRDLFRGDSRFAAQLRRQENVEILLSHQVDALRSDADRLTGLLLTDLKTGQQRELAVDGLFIAVGQEPCNQLFSTLVMTDERGYFLAGEDCATSLPGVFAAGDCRAKTVRRLITAVSDGAVAGLAASRYVDSRRDGT